MDKPTSATADPAERKQAFARVRDWTRSRFALPAEAPVLVSEMAVGLPGCPPLETHVLFLDGGKRHHFKAFKPVQAVVEEDLPYAWLKSTLVLPEGAGCDCC